MLFPESPTTRLADLAPGEEGDCFVLLAARDKASTRDGKPFYRTTFKDKRRSVTAMIWADSAYFPACDGEWKPGDFFRVVCRYEETKYGPQIELKSLRPVVDGDRAEGFDPLAFTASTRFDPAEMFAELRELVATKIESGPLRALTVEILDEFADDLRSFPAASRNHHAFSGGFVEHVLSVTKTAVFLAEKYAALYPDMNPPLSTDLVVAGAVLHDIGKLIELRPTAAGAEYTAPGRLVGHILLGRDLVRDRGLKTDGLDAETLLRLEHVVVSHQGKPEWGSPVEPTTPEALLVHYADDIDAKFEMVAGALTPGDGGETKGPTTPGEEFTGRDNALRRAIFRGLAE
ncbi:MAG: HD domain-containing protein [Planctomycetota bacterium]